MDFKQLDKSLTAIIEKKGQLEKLSYDDKNYDKLEEELHDLEDEFIENYGDVLEEAFQDVHDELCPDNEVLLPIAYVPNKFQIAKNPDGTQDYEVDFKEGVLVETEKYTGKETRLVLLPNPTRIVLLIKGQKKEVVWKAK